MKYIIPLFIFLAGIVLVINVYDSPAKADTFRNMIGSTTYDGEGRRILIYEEVCVNRMVYYKGIKLLTPKVTPFGIQKCGPDIKYPTHMSIR